MSRTGPAGRPAAGRSGDPRVRAGQATPAGRRPPRWALVAVPVVVVIAVVGLTLALRPGAEEPVSEGQVHADAACDLTADAATAAEDGKVDMAARFAAALLLDEAIIESERAATTDTAFGDLDSALQALHTAAHADSDAGWPAALEVATEECAAVAG